MLVECTDSALDPGNPGVVRTTRLLGQALLLGGVVRPVFVAWDRCLRQYRPLNTTERATLATYGGPQVTEGAMEEAPLLFLSEAPVDGQIAGRLLWAYARGMKVAGLLYDLIPVIHPTLCVPEIVRHFPEYLEAMCGVEALFAISGESLRNLERYAAENSLPLPGQRRAVWLPAQFGRFPRETSQPLPGPLRCLSVGSIEPRKNQAALIAAFDRLRRRRPDLQLELTLVGNRFAGAETLAKWIEALARETSAFRWLGIVDDDRLGELYRASAFTVYPSLVEGFGLPITESLWMGRACLCHRDGVMAELASGGGCMTTDMRDIGAIEMAIERLACDPDLRRRLTCEAQGRGLRDWTAYGAEIAHGLLEVAVRN